MDLIKLKEVTKEYRKKRVLEDASLIIEEGDVFGVIGQSGSGKTTLLSLIAGFIQPSEGEVIYVSGIDGKEHNLHKNLYRIKKQLGFAQQKNSFYPKLTVGENLLHFGQLYGLKKDVVQGNVKSLLQFTRLYEHRNKLAEELSGGMQKRLDISCSLVHKPKILLLDEPTSDLDPLLRREVLNLLQEVNRQGVTIILTSHLLDEIEEICNKVAIVHKGRVHSQGFMDDIKKPYLKEGFTIHLSPGKDKERIIARLRTMPVEKIVDKGNQLIIYPTSVEQTIGHLLSFIKEEQLYFHDLHLQRPSLREVFENIAAED